MRAGGMREPMGGCAAARAARAACAPSRRRRSADAPACILSPSLSLSCYVTTFNSFIPLKFPADYPFFGRVAAEEIF